VAKTTRMIRANFDAKLRKKATEAFDVNDFRHPVQGQRTIAEEACRHQGQGRIFRAADRYAAG
jgi:hypothetical protein